MHNKAIRGGGWLDMQSLSGRRLLEQIEQFRH